MKAISGRLTRLALAAPGLALLALGMFASVQAYRVASLVEDASEQNLRKATALAPSNAYAWSQLGSLLERRGDSDAAEKPLERAVELDEYSYGAWLDLGLHWEVKGNPEKAERCLREAVRVGGGYYPRWVLANFYLRQGGGDRFWTAMRDAMLHSREDLGAVFQLYWRASDNAREILEKGVPDRADINRQYCTFLVNSGRIASVPPVWRRVESDLQPRDREMGIRYAAALLAGREVDETVRVWNQLCAARLLPYQALDAVRGPLLTNGRFELKPSGRVFDWKLAELPDITETVVSSKGQPQLEIGFSGAHPETASLVSQVAPAAPRQTYQLNYRYSTTGLPQATGLFWSVEDGVTGEKLLPNSPLSAADEGWKEGHATLRTGSQTRLIRLLFGYRRAEGTVRSQGSVSLTDVELAPAGAQGQPDDRKREVNR